jgi:hypothetical protein
MIEDFTKHIEEGEQNATRIFIKKIELRVEDREEYPSLNTMVEEREEQSNVFQFPTQEIDKEPIMKDINHSALPHFYGLTIEDPYTFLFEFEFLCRTYDYKRSLKS